GSRETRMSMRGDEGSRTWTRRRGPPYDGGFLGRTERPRAAAGRTERPRAAAGRTERPRAAAGRGRGPSEARGAACAARASRTAARRALGYDALMRLLWTAGVALAIACTPFAVDSRDGGAAPLAPEDAAADGSPTADAARVADGP